MHKYQSAPAILQTDPEATLQLLKKLTLYIHITDKLDRLFAHIKPVWSGGDWSEDRAIEQTSLLSRRWNIHNIFHYLHIRMQRRNRLVREESDAKWETLPFSGNGLWIGCPSAREGTSAGEWEESNSMVQWQKRADRGTISIQQSQSASGAPDSLFLSIDWYLNLKSLLM